MNKQSFFDWPMATVMMIILFFAGVKKISEENQTLVKPATRQQYQLAKHPCPGYNHPTIFAALDGSEFGDCDNDGKVDEIHGPASDQWIFVLRLGVSAVKFKQTTYPGEDIPAGVTIYDDGSPWAAQVQRQFDLLQIANRKIASFGGSKEPPFSFAKNPIKLLFFNFFIIHIHLTNP